MELVPLLEESVAIGLLMAVWPICQERRTVKEQLILLLRKSMFRPDLSARMLAMRGFLFLVLCELQAPAAAFPDEPCSSQVTLVCLQAIYVAALRLPFYHAQESRRALT